MIEIKDSTEPTLDQVKALLEQGTYAEPGNTYLVNDLGHQFFATLPVVWRHRALFKAKGFGDRVRTWSPATACSSWAATSRPSGRPWFRSRSRSPSCRCSSARR
ncbi:MAG: hypothetical protein ABIJ09_21280 [Pseudomonadota bacterium]